jgi:hypothetical protein
VIVTGNDRINKNNFIVGRAGILIKLESNATKPLMPGDHVKVRIDSRKFNDSDYIIMCMGVLESMATHEESVNFSSDEYNINEKFIDHDKYIKAEEKADDMENVGKETLQEITSSREEMKGAIAKT